MYLYTKGKRTAMFRVAKLNPNAQIPQRNGKGDAGYDLFAVEDAVIDPQHWKGVGTGITLEFPSDCYARVAPRSGLAFKKGIDVFAGVVDSSYRGEIRVILMNHGVHPVEVKVGDRIAQIIFERIYTPDVLEEAPFEELTNTDRGEGGFGSTGA